MGILGAAGKLLWQGSKLAGKAVVVTTVVTAKVASKATVATAKVLYDNREAIGRGAVGATKLTAKATIETVKLAGKGTAYVASTAYEHRDVIGGAGVGLAKGTVNAARDVSAHVGNEKAVENQAGIIKAQSVRYQALTNKISRKLGTTPSRALLLDSVVVGGDTLVHYLAIGTVPPDLQHAYEMAYPGLAADHSFLTEIRHLDADQLQGFVAGVKGKLFEIQYTDYLNDGHLPDGFHAEMAHSVTNPGWDIAILGPDNSMREAIQLKATDSASYVHEALEKYPNIDVVTTSEVHSHLMLMGAAEHVSDSHITNHALNAALDSGIDQAVGSMHWTPSVISVALIAFSAYNAEGLSNYEKSKSFGERSVKSYLAYLAGGSVAVLTGTVWLGVLGGIGSRYVFGSGRKKRERLDQMKSLIASNETVLRRLEMQV